ncbi:Gfo/Idh/MocA family oxidoreductase [Candidatus Marinimicrobia bacterium]|nr:Gfo/Idh/MocA family oxidoreductase [Candidatus Neomarinimicrobiota bacterium]
MKNKINIAQIGVGYWGPNLLRNLIENKHCLVKYVVDLSKDRRDYVRRKYPFIKVLKQIDLILDDKELDAVIISTPVATHFELCMSFLNAGINVLVEKPMATKSLEVRKIGEVAKKKNLVAMVGHTFIYNSAVRYVKKIIDSQELGDIRYIYSQRVNLGRIRNDVDAMWNLAPHDISIIQYWLNDSKPIKVKRFGTAYVQKNIEDVVFLNIKYPNNILANIHVSWLDPNKIRKMTIVGSKKMVVYDDIAEDKVTIFDKGIDKVSVLGEGMDFDSSNSFEFKHRAGNVVVPKIKWEEPLKIEIEHFLNCILKKEKCITDALHAYNVVEILEKA